MILISICGHKEAGKDTVAEYLERYYDFKNIPLTTPLKKALVHLFDLYNNQLWGEYKETLDPFWDITPRELMQKFATDFFQKKIYKLIPKLKKVVPKRLFWCKLFSKRLEKENYWDCRLVDAGSKSVTFRYCISDMRYVHEAKYMKETYDSVILKIVRKDIKPNKFSKHASEKEIDKIKHDYLIDNNGTINNLYNKIDKIMKELDIGVMYNGS